MLKRALLLVSTSVACAGRGRSIEAAREQQTGHADPKRFAVKGIHHLATVDLQALLYGHLGVLTPLTTLAALLSEHAAVAGWQGSVRLQRCNRPGLGRSLASRSPTHHLAPPQRSGTIYGSTASANTGFGRWLLDAALSSPLYKSVLVPQAKATMVKTAEQNGVPWRKAYKWLREQGSWTLTPAEEAEVLEVPEYYQQPFHAYEEGNLCWDAALEGEIASRAVGARNFPAHGADGELAFRGAFEEALETLGAAVPDDGIVADLGCGTGISTRRIAAKFPRAAHIIGLDLSPHFLKVGRRLLKLGQMSVAEGTTWEWVNQQEGYTDSRVDLRRGLAEATGFEDASIDVVNVGLVIHELPPEATIKIAQEAHRVLRPGGQLWITEMDFQTPAFSKLRANPLLFSLIRSTEPYLDVYADYQPQLAADLSKLGFGPVRLAAATGRHFALVATKSMGPGGPIEDLRAETAKQDTHLKTWESKKMS